jgi:beta-alanine degradation protein BauB
MAANRRVHVISTTLGLALSVAGVTPVTALAQQVPSSFEANPEIYKVVAENDKFRVVIATWKPGQRDTQHSHPAAVSYYLTDCKSQIFGPDGSAAGAVRDRSKGFVGLQDPVRTHSFQNVGTQDCQLLMVERK